MNLLLADWRRAGRIGGATVAAAVVPVWSRTLGEFRAPFEAGGGSFAGLKLESIELFRLDNPYWHDNPAVFARDYVQSVTAWGGPLLLRAFAREGEARAAGLLADFLGELEERVAEAPDRYRWDYVEALVICRKTSDAGRGARPRLLDQLTPLNYGDWRSSPYKMRCSAAWCSWGSSCLRGTSTNRAAGSHSVNVCAVESGCTGSPGAPITNAGTSR